MIMVKIVENNSIENNSKNIIIMLNDVKNKNNEKLCQK